MLIHKETVTGTPASGSVTYTSNKLVGGIIKLINVYPLTATTTYAVELRDESGDTLWRQTNNTGEVVVEANIPVRGKVQTVITSASVDELFTTKLHVQEGVGANV